MKTIAIYAILGFLILAVVVFASSNTTNTKDETIERQQVELDSRRNEVYYLNKISREQELAIIQKDEIISRQNSAMKLRLADTELKTDEYIQQKEKLTKLEEELKVMTNNLTETENKLESLARENKELSVKKSTETEKPKEEPKTVEEPTSNETPESKEEPIEEPIEEPVEEPVEEPEPIEEPVEEPDPEPNPELEPSDGDDGEIEIPEDPTIEDEVSERRLTVEATAYIAMCDTGCSGITRTGYDVRNTIFYEGMRIIAVDPDVIPLYTKVRVYLDGSSFNAIALDTGGAIKGNKIDILVDDYNEAIAFGRQTIEVVILD